MQRCRYVQIDMFLIQKEENRISKQIMNSKIKMEKTIFSKAEDKNKARISESLLNELQKYPTAYKKIRGRVVIFRGAPAIEFSQILPMAEGIIIIAHSIFLIIHGQLIKKQKNHIGEIESQVKTTGDLILKLQDIVRKSEEYFGTHKNAYGELEETVESHEEYLKEIENISQHLNDITSKIISLGISPKDANKIIITVIIDTISLYSNQNTDKSS